MVISHDDYYVTIEIPNLIRCSEEKLYSFIKPSL